MRRPWFTVLILCPILIVACSSPAPNSQAPAVTRTSVPATVAAASESATAVSAAATAAAAAATAESAAATAVAAAATAAPGAISAVTATPAQVQATLTATPTLPPAETPTATAKAAGTPAPFADIEAQMVQAINNQRMQAGRPVLQADAQLAVAARGHATDMAIRNYYSHTTPEGKTLRDRLAALGLNPGRAGENFYVTSGEPGLVTQKTMDWFMNDPVHRDNLLGEQYNRVGVGVALGGNGLYVVVVDLAGE